MTPVAHGEPDRLTSPSRNTIRKWLGAPQGAEPKYRRRETPTELAPFVEVPDKALRADARRPRHERRAARALHAELQAQCYAGRCARLPDQIRAWRDEPGQASATRAFVPPSFERAAAAVRAVLHVDVESEASAKTNLGSSRVEAETRSSRTSLSPCATPAPRAQTSRAAP